VIVSARPEREGLPFAKLLGKLVNRTRPLENAISATVQQNEKVTTVSQRFVETEPDRVNVSSGLSGSAKGKNVERRP
jgi:hypothetical protein